ncbi:CBM96 family carbohydrate-binding protein [Dyadobacter sediminis]|uniref:DNRLRE domain-containing protein n=1 Tax=Dyadobacter sediminis TaxID=1493691 RepID=A0A5R9KBI6_9BACT|nr:malectin domain-containing carbohydrate-binding protein [Dyadobacter sediminis]TLU92077.1 DNRLRE domain-containing protein [Dyadobacter sediminis]GGB97629.1 hypothetical protein GCM10011325_26200 [Dyadobacter sediminis]
MKNTLRLKLFVKSLLALVVFVQANVYAQPVIQWDKTIGGTNNDALSQVLQTADGGYILGGNSNSDAGGDKTENYRGGYDPDGNRNGDYWIVKIAADGTKQWDKTFGTVHDDQLNSMQQTADGGYILGGSSNSDYWIIKLDANGTKQWEKTYDKGSSEKLTVVRPTYDGGFILGGSSRIPPKPNDFPLADARYEFWIVKITADGTKLWEKALAQTFTLTCLNLTEDGGYIMGGYRGIQQSSGGYYLVKLAANGTQQWTRTVEGTGYAEIRDVQQTPDRGFILGGWSDQDAGGDQKEVSRGDYWIVKLNPDRDIEWENVIAVPEDENSNVREEFQKLAQSPDGGYLLLGNSREPAGGDKTENSINGSFDFWIVKIDAGGNVLWDKTIGGSEGEFAASISTTFDGGYILGSTSNSNAGYNKSADSKGGIDYWIVKLAPESSSLPSAPIRINAGGQAFTTATKKLFSADKYYSGINRISSVASGDILNTSNDVLYQSARCSPSFSYNVPVPNGEVTVYLHFAETYFGAPGKKGGKGSRQFHVNMEGVRKLTNYDIFDKAGRAMLATAEIFTVNVTDGMLNIDFLTGAADLPRISAIEVLPIPKLRTQTFTPEADAMVRGGTYQDQNFGLDPLMDVKNGHIELQRRSYLRFAIPGVQNIKSAKLRVYGHNHESSVAYVLAAGGVLDDTWTETGITYSNAPSILNAPKEARTSVRGEWAYAELDVTEFVKTQAAGDQVASFALNGAAQRMVFHTKENPSGFAPQLVIVTDITTNSVTRLGNDNQEASKTKTGLSSVIYPNPAKDHIMLEVSSGHTSEVDLELTNVAGSQFQLQRPVIEDNSTRLKVGLPGQLPAGMYLLKVQSSEFSEVLKVLVTE